MRRSASTGTTRTALAMFEALNAIDRRYQSHLGIEPSEQPILALKSSVHFRADFEPIAAEEGEQPLRRGPHAFAPRKRAISAVECSQLAI